MTFEGEFKNGRVDGFGKLQPGRMGYLGEHNTSDEYTLLALSPVDVRQSTVMLPSCLVIELAHSAPETGCEFSSSLATTCQAGL